MKKPLKLIWIGTDLDCVTTGKLYTITGKFKADKSIKWFCYVFINDNGDEDNAASYLFASPKKR